MKNNDPVTKKYRTYSATVAVELLHIFNNFILKSPKTLYFTLITK